MPYQVYKISNTVNSKLYVGCTTINFETRFYEHIRHVLNPRNTPLGGCHALHEAMLELGTDKFHPTLIEAGNGTQAMMFSRESYWIRELSSIAPNGYNVRSRLLSDEQVAIIRFNVLRLTQKEYAKLFGVSQSTIAVARTGRGSCYDSDPYAYITRKHLPVDLSMHTPIDGRTNEYHEGDVREYRVKTKTGKKAEAIPVKEREAEEGWWKHE